MKKKKRKGQLSACCGRIRERIVNNVGVTTNVTHHIRDNHQEEYQQWLTDLETCGASQKKRVKSQLIFRPKVA